MSKILVLGSGRVKYCFSAVHNFISSYRLPPSPFNASLSCFSLLPLSPHFSTLTFSHSTRTGRRLQIRGTDTSARSDYSRSRTCVAAMRESTPASVLTGSGGSTSPPRSSWWVSNPTPDTSTSMPRAPLDLF